MIHDRNFNTITLIVENYKHQYIPQPYSILPSSPFLSSVQPHLCCLLPRQPIVLGLFYYFTIFTSSILMEVEKYYDCHVWPVPILSLECLFWMCVIQVNMCWWHYHRAFPRRLTLCLLSNPQCLMCYLSHRDVLCWEWVTHLSSSISSPLFNHSYLVPIFFYFSLSFSVSPPLPLPPIIPHSSSTGHGGEVTNGAGSRRLSRQNSADGGQVAPVAGEPHEHTIDCGDIVWGLAFGSSVPEKQSRCVNIEWHRFKFGQDQLLLATGLNNGRIKIWDVYTGEESLQSPVHSKTKKGFPSHFEFNNLIWNSWIHFGLTDSNRFLLCPRVIDETKMSE